MGCWWGWGGRGGEGLEGVQVRWEGLDLIFCLFFVPLSVGEVVPLGFEWRLGGYEDILTTACWQRAFRGSRTSGFS